MSVEQNKTVLRRWIEAFRPGNLSTLERLADEYYTADYVLHDPDWPDLPPGPEGVKQFVRDILTRMPDHHITLEEMIAEGDTVASRINVTGTDASTGKPTRLMVIAISRFAGAKIAEEWELAG